jgi:hypothetical protein
VVPHSSGPGPWLLERLKDRGKGKERGQSDKPINVGCGGERNHREHAGYSTEHRHCTDWNADHQVKSHSFIIAIAHHGMDAVMIAMDVPSDQ